MDKTWFRKLFSRPPTPEQPVLAGIPPQTDYADAEAQFSMGVKFANGEGATQDYVQAAEWYLKAADQRHSLAQYNLGIMYAHGQGVTPDAARSAMWFGKAAQAGDAGAQFYLGNRCQRASLGRVREQVSESMIEAYKWYRLAAAQGYLGSEMAYATLSLNMTREDVAAGNRRFAEFEAAKS